MHVLADSFFRNQCPRENFSTASARNGLPPSTGREILANSANHATVGPNADVALISYLDLDDALGPVGRGRRILRILITEVTEMHHANYCVAGWCATTGQMVRPLPNGANWTAPLLAANGITPGATVEVTDNGTQPNGIYPHLTEDLLIDPATINLVNPGPATWFGANAPPIEATLSEAFENHIQHNSVWNGILQGVHVQSGTRCRSLWAIGVERDAITFVEDFNKLKAELDDGAASYKLAVSSRVLKEAWRQGGTQAVNQLIPAATRLHVRIGLARAFEAQANKCFVMINDLNW